MENTKYGKRREGRWTPIRAKAQDTRANPNSWETHLVRQRWDIGLLRALSLRIIMMMDDDGSGPLGQRQRCVSMHIQRTHKYIMPQSWTLKSQCCHVGLQS